MSSPAPLQASRSVEEAVMNLKGESGPESKPEEQRTSPSEVPGNTEPTRDDEAERQSVHSSHELKEATPAISAGVGEPEHPTGDENPGKAADPVAKAEGETTAKLNNPEPAVPGLESEFADTAGKQTRRSTMRFLPKGRPNRPTYGSKKRGGGGGCIIF